MNQNPANHSVRRVVLPSGRSIEVVRLDFQAPVPKELHLCSACGSKLVQPLSWGEVKPGSWRLTLRCPDCESITRGVFTQDQVNLLEEQLDHGLTEMLSDLRRLTQANMSEEIDRFVAALHTDLVLPEDF